MNPHRKPLRSVCVFFAFFIALFMIFTPYEAAGSMLPKHIAAGVSLAVLAPFIFLKRMGLKASSFHVLLVSLVIALHTLFIRPTPGHFTLLILANFMVAVLIYELSFKWINEFKAALACLLILNIAAIVLQLSLYYLYSTTIVDFHKLIFGSSSRFSEDYLNVRRFSGLHVEPGTYASYVGCLLSIFILVARRNMITPVIVFAGVFSILLTNSASAVHFVIVVSALFGLLWKDGINKSLLAGFIVLVVAYAFYSGFYEHLSIRFFEQEDGSLSLRRSGVNSYFSLSGEDKFIGVGFDADPCHDCHYQDIGVLFNLFTRGGAIVMLVTSLLFLRAAAQNGIPFFVLAMALLIGEKMFVYEAPIWLFVLYAISAIREPTPRIPTSLPRTAKICLT